MVPFPTLTRTTSFGCAWYRFASIHMSWAEAGKTMLPPSMQPISNDRRTFDLPLDLRDVGLANLP
ncbi:MAG: hypothetical protein Kow00109_12030 [Acidobacteriota bacterium]